MSGVVRWDGRRGYDASGKLVHVAPLRGIGADLSWRPEQGVRIIHRAPRRSTGEGNTDNR